MVRIPSEYQEVEYLESTGTQYIVTGNYLSEDVEAEFRCSYTSYGQRYSSMFGAIVSSNSNPAFVSFRDVNGSLKVAGRFGKWTNANSSYIDTDVTYAYGDVIEGKCGINWIEYNGVRHTGDLIWDSALANAKMGIFCRALGDTAYTNSIANGRIYGLKFSNQNGIVANLIPCYRKSDNEPGMYDLVTGTFFTNSGTGTFLVGNDVEYSTVSLLEARRKILLNTPHLTSASGQLATFNTDLSVPLKEMKVHFYPVQASGTPSPDNVLPISGWDGVTVYNGQTVVASITFPQTIYGGYVDLVKGEVVEEYGTEVLNGSEVWGTQAENDTYYIKFLHGLSGGVVTGALNSGGLSNYIKTATSNKELKKTGNLCCRFGWGDRSLYILNAPIGLNGVTDLASFKSYLSENNLIVVYPLATPNHYPLTPQTIKTLKGLNNVFSDANGNVDVTYWTH